MGPLLFALAFFIGFPLAVNLNRTEKMGSQKNRKRLLSVSYSFAIPSLLYPFVILFKFSALVLVCVHQTHAWTVRWQVEHQQDWLSSEN